MSNQFDIKKVLLTRYEGSQWVLNGDTYSGLEWLSDTQKPSEDDLLSLWPGVDYELNYRIAEVGRRAAYAETSDPIFFEFQRGDKTQQEWLDAVKAVKAANPYPKPPKK